MRRMGRNRCRLGSGAIDGYERSRPHQRSSVALVAERFSCALEPKRFYGLRNRELPQPRRAIDVEAREVPCVLSFGVDVANSIQRDARHFDEDVPLAVVQSKAIPAMHDCAEPAERQMKSLRRADGVPNVATKRAHVRSGDSTRGV